MILVFMHPRNKQSWEDYQQEETLTSLGFSPGRAEMGRYHISDMIPVALPPRVAGAGLTRSLFVP